MFPTEDSRIIHISGALSLKTTVHRLGSDLGCLVTFRYNSPINLEPWAD